MFTRIVGIMLGLIVAFGVTKAYNPHSPMVLKVEHVWENVTS